MKLRVIHNLGVHFDVRGGDPDVRGGGRDEAANAGARTADGDVPMVVVTGGGRAVAEDGAQTVVEGGARTVAEDGARMVEITSALEWHALIYSCRQI
ncbi:hypothetical protein DPMN_004982 [Dreissena polymorpha]|uniref:Uncharacterized protein n=1 Tax=Dreissena polymorpha TaxID=45954 RepID=A0A9D4MPG2_DREPO|nr:hypothetical protein DPMN_004982 [Dreissena polymorpha]